LVVNGKKKKKLFVASSNSVGPLAIEVEPKLLESYHYKQAGYLSVRTLKEHILEQDFLLP
jgi:hypothetical protein